MTVTSVTPSPSVNPVRPDTPIAPVTLVTPPSRQYSSNKMNWE